MPLPLPNLDDRRWADLVEEGRALIPTYAPEWTDHNVHDPGITLMELFAWVAEMDLFRLNRVPEAHRRKFLALIGVRPIGPRAAQTVLGLTLTAGQPGGAVLSLPTGTDLTGQEPAIGKAVFRTLAKVNLAAGRLASLLVRDEHGLHDYLARTQRREEIEIFGENPQPGAELYLGLDAALPPDVPVSFFFAFGGGRSDAAERLRLQEEAAETGPAPEDLDPGAPGPDAVLRHHSVRIAWEFWDGQDWRDLQVEDETRSFTLDGCVSITAPAAWPMVKRLIGPADVEAFYLRGRLAEGAYEAAPRLKGVLLNAAPVEQAWYSLAQHTWAIAPGALISGPEPAPGDCAAFSVPEFDGQGRILKLAFLDLAAAPTFWVSDYQRPAANAAGSLTIGVELLGYGTSAPWQQLDLSTAPVQEESLRLFTWEAGQWRSWEPRPDFDASGVKSRHFRLDATLGRVIFGDGEHGCPPPAGAVVLADYRGTSAAAGNLPTGAAWQIADTGRNRLLPDKAKFAATLAEIVNPFPAAGGAAAETFDQAARRALAGLKKPRRAVTLADYEALALDTPGTQLARASARANLHPAFPGLAATGIITVIILPFIPAARPVPGPELCRAVAAYLNRRRVIGSRVEVVGPNYTEVGIRAQVQAFAGNNPQDLRRRLAETLTRFFHPLQGGPDGSGWPFGRDVYRSEVLQVIVETPGVDHVLSLELIAQGGEAQCGNLCLGPLALVALGTLDLEVV